jgi:hypothetical protein
MTYVGALTIRARLQAIVQCLPNNQWFHRFIYSTSGIKHLSSASVHPRISDLPRLSYPEVLWAIQLG